MEEEVFTRDEAAAFLKVDKGTIAQWIKSGRLAATRKIHIRKKPIPDLQNRLYCGSEEPDPQSTRECG
jgi:predicted site-specific integrase-resolvase